MIKPAHKTFKIVYRVAVHILLLGITAFVFLVVLSDLLVPELSSITFLAGFLLVCLLIAGLCLYGIWETTESRLRLDRRLFGFDMEEARENTTQDVTYFYSILNIYLVFNTTVVVGAWFLFPDQLSRAESLAYILTILSALSGYSSGVIKRRLSELEATTELPT
jgi:hypothetical protein